MGVNKIINSLLIIILALFASYSSFTDRLNRIKNQHNESIAGVHKSTLKKTIESSVRVISSLGFDDSENITSTSSGTYFVYNEKLYVLTAAHSLIGPCNTSVIIADEYVFDCLELKYLDNEKDIAIMEVDNIINRTPIDIVETLCTATAHKNNTRIHEQIFYTGYPQGLGPLTFDGKIVSDMQYNDIFFAHSYAWSGSSGSAVFNENGKLIGVLTAVSVANTEYGVDVMEDLIIITSLTLADLQSFLQD